MDKTISTLRFVDKPYFRAYKEWTSSTSGVKTITIYSGSANSKFQFHLPSGEERKIRFIIPPTEREFKKIISDENSTLKFMKEKEINRLEIATGRNFREMCHYIQVFHSDYDVYMEKTKRNMAMRLEIYVSEANEKELDQFLKNLDILFDLRFTNKNPSFTGPFYDRGLIYDDNTTTIKFLNLPAKEVLLRYYLDHIKMERIGDWEGADLQGKFLEKYCVKSDLSSEISIALHRSGSQNGPKDLLRYEVNGFEYLEDLCIGDGKQYFKTTLLSSKNPLFPYIDYVIYTPPTSPKSPDKVIFKQISMSTITSHMKTPKDEFVQSYMKVYPELNESVGEVMRFLCFTNYKWDLVKEEEEKEKGKCWMKQEQKDKGKSVCHLILELLFGEIKNYEVKIIDGKFSVFVGGKRVDLEIVYVTGTKMDENKEIWNIPLKNIVCCFREDLERLKIPF